MTNHNRRWIGWTALAAIAVAAGCGGSSATTTASSTRAYLGTQGPGDVWDWTILPDTFTANNETQVFTYAGTKTVLPTGFLKLTVNSTNDPGVTTGSSAYALELPNTALVIKPAGADTKPPIFAGSLGTNPPGPTVTFNYVKVPDANWLSSEQEAYGHVTFTVTGSDYQGPLSRYTIDDVALSSSTCHFTGLGGKMTDLNGPNGYTSTGAMTPSGVCVIDYGPGQGGTIGVEQPAANVDLADFASKKYNGFLINSGKTQCVTCTPNGDGTLHGDGYANPGGVETGTLDGGGGVTIQFTSQVAPGLVKVHLVYGGGNVGSDSLVGAVSKVNGKYMMFAFATTPGQGNQPPYNVMLVQQ